MSETTLSLMVEDVKNFPNYKRVDYDHLENQQKERRKDYSLTRTIIDYCKNVLYK